MRNNCSVVLPSVSHIHFSFWDTENAIFKITAFPRKHVWESGPGSNSFVILNFSVRSGCCTCYKFVSFQTVSQNCHHKVCSTLRDFPFPGIPENQHGFHWKSEQQPFVTNLNSSVQITYNYLLCQIIISILNSEIFLLNWFLFFF